jgi:subtilisin family serine protease
MAIVIGKKQLLSTDLKYFKALQGIDGKTLFDRYKLAETNIISTYIDKKYKDFLAYPVQEGNTIVFYAKNYEETPLLLSGLQGDDLAKYSSIKDETLAHYNNIIGILRNSGKTVEAEFLANAVKYVDKRFIYCYDNIVVLGVWGMQLRDNIREDISEICKNLVDKKKNPPPPTPPAALYTLSFNAGSNGNLNGNTVLTKQSNEFLSVSDIPQVEANEGFEFIGWDQNPDGYEVTSNKEFTAQYNPKELIPPVISPDIPPELPWYKRFWNWLKALFLGRGCLKWLLWLLLLLLLLLLFWWLFRSCSHNVGVVGAIGDNDSTWVREDPRVGDGGGIYDPGDPYKPLPTPPGYKEVLPPQQGVLPPIDDNPEIIPGNPTIIGNRLNILMENEDKSIMDLAKDFKAEYPDEKYKVVYYDNVVKRMQIEIPSEERQQLKQEIPGKFAPQYNLFVFDEALFEGAYTPNDPAFQDNNKNWYLKAIKAPQAWDITRGSEKITVAIVDNGFNLKHPELSSKVVQPYNVWKHSKEIFPQQIDHGTHVAGTALAIADNAKGICGIAPNCKFMPIQVADERGMMTTTSVLDGILYALYQGADVINVSLGSQFKGLSQFSENEQLDLIKNHFKEEERLWNEIMRIAASHNSTIVVAAGNDNVLAGIDALQRPELFITVSAVDKNNQNFTKANFSNFGSYSTISAPGVGIYSSVGSNDYETMDGTSMAAPIVAGAVALMKSFKSSLTTKQIICILKSTGLPAQGNIGKLIQLDKALQLVKSGEVVDCTPIPSSGDVQILLNWNNYNDLDLCCTDPQGETVWFKNKRVASGGQLEIDMNVEYPDSKNPIENIYWIKNGAPNGTYNVYLLYYKKHETNINETPYAIKVKYGNKTEDFNGVIKKEDKAMHICTFTLGDGNNIQNPPNTNPDNPNIPENDRRNSLLKQREQLQQELDRIDRELRSLGNHR